MDHRSVTVVITYADPLDPEILDILREVLASGEGVVGVKARWTVMDKRSV